MSFACNDLAFAVRRLGSMDQDLLHRPRADCGIMTSGVIFAATVRVVRGNATSTMLLSLTESGCTFVLNLLAFVLSVVNS